MTGMILGGLATIIVGSWGLWGLMRRLDQMKAGHPPVDDDQEDRTP